MVASLNLEETGGHPPCDALLLVKDLDGLLFIGEVGLELDEILRNRLRGYSEALLELRDVEHVVDAG